MVPAVVGDLVAAAVDGPDQARILAGQLADQEERGLDVVLVEPVEQPARRLAGPPAVLGAEARRDVLGKVRRVLGPDSTLFLGGAETTLNIDTAFRRVPLAGSVCYRLGDPDRTD